jgi:hypothetical protein
VHEFERQFRRRANIEGILALVVGVIVGYILQYGVGLGGRGILQTIIVVGVGGFWYHLRRVI